MVENGTRSLNNGNGTNNNGFPAELLLSEWLKGGGGGNVGPENPIGPTPHLTSAVAKRPSKVPNGAKSNSGTHTQYNSSNNNNNNSHPSPPAPKRQRCE